MTVILNPNVVRPHGQGQHLAGIPSRVPALPVVIHREDRLERIVFLDVDGVIAPHEPEYDQVCLYDLKLNFSIFFIEWTPKKLQPLFLSQKKKFPKKSKYWKHNGENWVKC